METKTQKRETIKNKTRKCKKRGLKGRKLIKNKNSKKMLRMIEGKIMETVNCFQEKIIKLPLN